MSTNLTPLIVTGESRKETPEVGDLVTIKVYNFKTQDFDLEVGARINRMEHGDVWINLADLEVPAPYSIGMPLIIPVDQVVDW